MTRFRNDETGAVAIFFVVAVVGLFAMAGLAVDGAAKIRGIQRADAVAAEAARAAGQAISIPAAMTGSDVRVDRALAVRSAQAYLRGAGVVGAVSVTDGGHVVSVDTTMDAATVFLAAVGIGHFTVHGHASATLIHSIDGSTP